MATQTKKEVIQLGNALIATEVVTIMGTRRNGLMQKYAEWLIENYVHSENQSPLSEKIIRETLQSGAQRHFWIRVEGKSAPAIGSIVLVKKETSPSLQEEWRIHITFAKKWKQNIGQATEILRLAAKRFTGQGMKLFFESPALEAADQKILVSAGFIRNAEKSTSILYIFDHVG